MDEAPSRDGAAAGRELLEPAFLARLERLELVARRVLAGEARGDLRSRRRGFGSLFRDHQRYAQGDDLRFLDWNVYRRLGELLIKQFEAEGNLELLLVLDASGSMDYGRANKFEAARRLAAALGWIALGRHADVRLVLSPAPEDDGAGRADRHRPLRGRAGAGELLRRLAAAPAPAGAADLVRDLRPHVSRRRTRGLAIVVSDFLLEGGHEEALRLLARRGHRVACIQVLDELDLHPGLSGRLRMVDIESARARKGQVSPRLLRAYEAEVRRWCESVAAYCRRHEIAFATVDSASRLEHAVEKLLFAGGIVG